MLIDTHTDWGSRVLADGLCSAHVPLLPHVPGRSRPPWQTILGISLGAPSHLTMTPARGGQRVEVLLPRRSCYVLSGRARWVAAAQAAAAAQRERPRLFALAAAGRCWADLAL